MKYYLDIIGEVEAGTVKARRLGWPKDKNGKALKYIKKTSPFKLEVEGLKEVTPPNEVLLVDPKNGHVLGYVPSQEDRQSMDWETLPIE